MLASMEMGVDPRVNSIAELCAVNHRAPKFRMLFVNCVDRTTENPERKLGIPERTDKCTELGLLVDILLDVLLEK